MDGGIAIALAIPVFVGLILVEWRVATARGVRAYRLTETLTCLSSGLSSQGIGLLIRALPVGIYAFVEHTIVPWSLDPTSPWTWAVAILAVDHQFYWWHRASHRIRVLWASHRVHHSSEDYNLAVALRQEWLGPLTHLPFQLPIALLGVPVEVWLAAELIDLLYQFWIHTEQIDRLPAPIEAVFNTPSHHRVHHGVDPIYIDRNHGGMLILWDRLYGTFTEERQRPTYGTVTPLRSVDPVWANVQPWHELQGELRRIPTWRGRLAHVFAPPERFPAELGGDKIVPEPDPQRRTWDVVPGREQAAYLVVQVAGIGLATIAMLTAGDTWARPVLVGFVIWVVAGTGVLGGLAEQRPSARPAELLRLLSLPLLVALVAPPVAAVGVGFLSLTSILWFRVLPTVDVTRPGPRTPATP